MKLTVEQLGNPSFPRYAIKCENGTWWNGYKKTWTPHQKEATLYAQFSVIKEDWKKLQKKAEDVIELECTIKVKLMRDKPLTDEDRKALAFFMASATEFTLDYEQPRPPGFEDVNISTQIHWDFKETQKKKS